jgi:DNA-directed RNA polymerase subunit RPC12/RpoP
MAVADVNDARPGDGLQRTSIYCHSCSKTFLARVDTDIEGNHEIECPHCAHLHYRKIEQGKVTEGRWQNDSSKTIRVDKRNVWKHNDLRVETSTAAAFLIDRWFNREDSW